MDCEQSVASRLTWFCHTDSNVSAGEILEGIKTSFWLDKKMILTEPLLAIASFKPSKSSNSM